MHVSVNLSFGLQWCSSCSCFTKADYLPKEMNCGNFLLNSRFKIVEKKKKRLMLRWSLSLGSTSLDWRGYRDPSAKPRCPQRLSVLLACSDSMVPFYPWLLQGCQRGVLPKKKKKNMRLTGSLISSSIIEFNLTFWKVKHNPPDLSRIDELHSREQ